MTGTELFNTTSKPDGYDSALLQAKQASAYHVLDPYPYFHFQEWRTEEQGAMPRCMPLPRHIVKKGASWLFGKPVQFTCQENEPIENYLNDAWARNSMLTKMRACAEAGGVDGNPVLKFSFDEKDAKSALRFQILSGVDNCRLYYDPHDQEKLLMARVQYMYFDPMLGDYYLYREEWSDETLRVYVPRKAKAARSRIDATTVISVPMLAEGGSNQDPDEDGDWQVDKEDPNIFGIIPIVGGKNIDNNSNWGTGDLWGLFRVVDRINLAYHLMDRSNQLDSDVMLAVIDGHAENDAMDRATAPGEKMSIKSDSAENQASLEMLEPSGKVRPYIKDYADDLKAMLMDAASAVEVRMSDITNKGNLTRAVMEQVYAPIIESTEQKRRNYGENMICGLLEKVCIGLKNIGVQDFQSVSAGNPETYDVQINWPDYFPLSDEEKMARTTRLSLMVEKGFTTRERVIKDLARMDDVLDIEALEGELQKVEQESPTPQGQNGVGDNDAKTETDGGESND